MSLLFPLIKLPTSFRIEFHDVVQASFSPTILQPYPPAAGIMLMCPLLDQLLQHTLFSQVAYLDGNKAKNIPLWSA